MKISRFTVSQFYATFRTKKHEFHVKIVHWEANNIAAYFFIIMLMPPDNMWQNAGPWVTTSAF